MYKLTNVCIIVGCVLLLSACGKTAPTKRTFENDTRSASLQVWVYDYGGAAGFQETEVHLVAGADGAKIATFEHLSNYGIEWTGDTDVTFCYVGEPAPPRNVSVVLGEREFTLSLRDDC